MEWSACSVGVCVLELSPAFAPSRLTISSPVASHFTGLRHFANRCILIAPLMLDAQTLTPIYYSVGSGRQVSSLLDNQIAYFLHTRAR